MKFAPNRATSLHRLLLAGLLATMGASAMAQGAPATPPAGPATVTRPAGPPGDHMGHHDPAKMQAEIAKRQAEMKAILKITPAQEGIWTAYTASMQPPAHSARPTPEQRAELDQLSTPQRIDKMRELRTQRMSEMAAQLDKRGAAIKTFYAALTTDQQKVFEAEHKRHERHDDHDSRDGPHGARPQKG